MADEKPKDSDSKLIAALKDSLLTDPAFRYRLQEALKGQESPDDPLRKYLETLVAAGRQKAAETNVVDSALANQWLNTHWKKRNCSICGQVTWAMAPAFAHIPMNLMGRHSAAMHSFPCVVLTCRICGNTLFFNAIAMGLLPEGAD